MKFLELKKTVKELMLKSTVSGYSHYFDSPYVYTQPSAGKYQWQFFWDTCLHSIILCDLNLGDIAQQNIDTLLVAQQPNGSIGHMVYWDDTPPLTSIMLTHATPHELLRRTTAITQPPLLARAVKEVYDHTKDKDWLKKTLPKVAMYFQWLSRRDIDGSKLLVIISPLESGMDDKPSFNSALDLSPETEGDPLTRKVEVAVNLKHFLLEWDIEKISKNSNFLIKEVCFNTMYAVDLIYLSELYKILDNNDKAEHYKKLSHKVGVAIVEQLYDSKDAAFYDYDYVHKKHLKVLTSAMFLPLLLPQVSSEVADALIIRHALNKDEFYTQYPLPSVAINHPSFTPDSDKSLWRGPVWLVQTWLLFRTLHERGFADYAKYLLDKNIDMVEKSGFRENYNTFTGHGAGAEHFTWSSLLLDIIEKNHDVYTFKDT